MGKLSKKRDNHSSNWSSKGGGLHRHGTTGHNHNHRVTIEMNREAAREIERQQKIRDQRRKKGLVENVRDLFKGA